MTRRQLIHRTDEELRKASLDYVTYYPILNGPDLVFLEKSLARAWTKGDDSFDVLEWGSGGSTRYFSRLLASSCPRPFRWTAIDHLRWWAERVEANLVDLPTAKVVLFDAGEDDPKIRRSNFPAMENYVSWPWTHGKLFDVIIVDGRWRRRCLLEATRLLKPRGICLLHDAHREHYHCAFSAFAAGSGLIAGTHWWRGVVNQVRTS